MKITINNIEYTDIKSIAFSDEVDILSSELPVNQFTAEIKTTDNIAVGQYAYLYSDADLWAKYWVTDSARYKDDILTIICQSETLLLDRATLPPIIYNGATAGTILTSLFNMFGISVTIDSSIANTTISGYCPEQSVRERIQQICFVIGGYVSTGFSSTGITAIKAVDDVTVTNILSDRVFQYPTISNNDYTTAVKVVAYTYTQGTPQTVDEYVTIDDGQGNLTYYIQTKQEFTVSNPNVPALAPSNVVEFTETYLINQSNVSGILTRLSTYYFKRGTVSADIINNGDFTVGKKYMLDCGNGDCVIGFAVSNDFTFGKNIKSNITINSADIVEGVKLTFICICNSDEKGRYEYHLPSGYGYRIQMPVIKRLEADLDGFIWLRIYSAVVYYAEGTVPNTDTEITVQYRLSMEQRGGVLRIYNVDDLEFDQVERVIEIE